MLTRSRFSRLASAGALVLATVTLSSCGFNYATDKVYTPAEGVNNRDSRVDVLNAAIVATEDGKGTFVASLSNNDTPTYVDGKLTDVDDKLTGLAGVGVLEGQLDLVTMKIPVVANNRDFEGQDGTSLTPTDLPEGYSDEPPSHE